MPAEYRNILFSDDEIVEAFLAVLKLRGETPPENAEATLIHSRNGTGDPVSIMAYSNRQPSVEFHLNSREVMAALMNFCMEQGVPLPRRSEKKADIIDQKLMLRLRRDAEAFAVHESDDDAEKGDSGTAAA